MYLNYIKILRFDHWAKQIFVLPGFFYATYLVDFELIFNFDFYVKVFLSLLLISLAASSNYVINEFIDGPNDKHHPLKKKKDQEHKINLV